MLSKFRRIPTGFPSFGGRGGGQTLPAMLTALLLMLPHAAYAQSKFQLADVKVVGSTRYQVPEIIRATGLKVGSNISLDELKDATDRIGSLGVFSQVSYRYATRGSTMTAEFDVVDAPGLLPCTFGNLVWFSPEELQQALRSRVPLFEGGVPAAGKMLDVIQAQLTAMLEARGLHAQVQVLPHANFGGPIQSMEIRVTGIAIPIHKIEFTGVQKVDAALLHQAASPLLDKDYDVSFVQDFAANKIRDVYRERGFLRANFGQPSAHLISGDPVPNAVGLALAVTEGEQYRLKDISWSGESAIPYAELGKSLHAAKGEPMNAVQLDRDVLALILFYHPKGYLDADARAREALDDDTHTGVFEVQIRQGDLYRMGTLQVAGLDDAHALAVQQRSRLHPGDPFDSTYWGLFMQEVAPQLPRTTTGWQMKPEITQHPETKTVDVRLTFSPGGPL